MLEKASDRELSKLASARGKTMTHVDIRELPAGSLVQLCTESGNTYILQTTDPLTSLAHIARYSPLGGTSLKGYLGERTISPSILSVGGSLSHNSFTTRLIVSLALLSS
jgi:hypothetical protein